MNGGGVMFSPIDPTEIIEVRVAAICPSHRDCARLRSMSVAAASNPAAEGVPVRLGEVLISQGLLTATQVIEVLREQTRTGLPFGVLCEEMFDIEPDVVEDAWVKQYEMISRPVDPTREIYDDSVSDLVTRRQAWQFRVLPIRYDGDELLVATTASHLRRALRFATRTMAVPVYLLLSAPGPLMEVLAKRYPMAGFGPDYHDDHVNDLVGRLALRNE